MRTYQKIAQADEQELFAKLLPKRMRTSQQKVFWRINTAEVNYELVAVSRLPAGITVVDEWSNPTELSAIRLEENDLFECFDKKTTVGKYNILTKCFTGGSDKFDDIVVQWDQVIDMTKTNCVGIEQLGVTTQVTSKKRTHISDKEKVKSTTMRLYYKFKFM